MAEAVGHVQDVDSVGVPDVVVGWVAREIGRKPVGKLGWPVGERAFRMFPAALVGMVIGVPLGGGCRREGKEHGIEEAEDTRNGRHLVQGLQRAGWGRDWFGLFGDWPGFVRDGTEEYSTYG